MQKTRIEQATAFADRRAWRQARDLVNRIEAEGGLLEAEHPLRLRLHQEGRRIYEQAYQLLEQDPDEARDILRQALTVLPESDPLTPQIRRYLP